MLLWVVTVASLAFCLDPQKDLGQYGHRAWQTDSGLPQNTVHAVIQTQDGYIWLGTEGGLVRFDGFEFVIYDKQAPAFLRSESINSLFEDKDGDLWIGTNDGLVRRRGNHFTNYGASNGLPSNTVGSIFQDHRGKIWVVTLEGIASYQGGEQFRSFPMSDGITNPKSLAEALDGSFWIGTRFGAVHFNQDHFGPPLLLNVEVQTVAATGDGRIWLGTHNGLYSFPSGSPEKNAPVSGLPSSDVASLTAAKDGSLWIGTAKGAAVLKNGELTAFSAQNGLPSDRVESVVEDREGSMWIATSRGLARIVKDHVQTFGGRESLSSGAVLSIFEDREGSLWLGTESGGLEMLHDQKFTAYTTADGLSDDLVRSIIQDRKGIVWSGTSGGGLDRQDSHGTFTSLSTADGLSSDIVLALGSDAAGNLWVGTPDGLDRIVEDSRGRRTITTFTSADGLADDFVRSLYAASDGSMWIGTRRGISHFSNGRFTTYSSMDGLGSDLVGAIVEDPAHVLWIATLGGLTRFDHGKFTTLTTRDGLSSNVITSLYPDKQGSLWIGTNQGGLNRLKDGKLADFSSEATHLPESIYAILEDARGNLWLGSKTGIYRATKKDLDDFANHRRPSISPAVYGTADGMKISECSSGGHPAACKLTNGSMLFATLKGIAAVDPERLTLNTVPPSVVIEQVLVDDQVIDDPVVPKSTSAAAFIVPPGHRRFEFHYAGLSFIAPQKVRFRYKLEGFDRDWVDAGARRTAYYTNLPPGAYSFRVIASNNDGVWNQSGASSDFRLQPHLYQTWWFYLALIAALALFAYQAYHWRLRQIELRYDAVLSERGRIAREIHDTLAQGLVGISVQLELVNRLLASSVESARAQLDQARGLVRESLTEARSSIWDLRSQAAETEDFATRLARMAATATERSTSKIRVKSKVSGAYRPVSPKAEAELLRIAQEAVTNAVRHAQPVHIAIELRFGARDLLMTIQDDGCGFNGQLHPQSSGPQGHFGLAGMRERAEQIGAIFVVDSAPGKGTRVSVQVPIDA
ncbi:putative two-component system sensor kinase [Acidisarcina polymorpha]|uniref:Putative two-component system sensor kinase n=1 Tax=Acidisarcina polymorpha TaxID=2211140 RepID=A0A2Z5FWX7_9BACT|nr:putative two-component system sensor kinase [Acidisarcina polymorpha]